MQRATEARYYQIGGFHAHSEAWDRFRYDNAGLSQAIAGDTSPLRSAGFVELVLGIHLSGASYLHMTHDQMVQFTFDLRLRQPRNYALAHEFQSLSPIRFSTADQLAAKLKTYAQKSKKHQVGVPDNSQANKGFISDNPKLRGGEPLGKARSSFEHGRLLWSILRREIDCSKFGLVDPPWVNSLRFISLAVNTWQADERKRAERLSDPKVLDVGWTQFSEGDIYVKQENDVKPYRGIKNEPNVKQEEEEPGPNVSVHVRVLENKALQNPGSKVLDFEHGNTENVSRTALASRLQALFSQLHETRASPVVLLVYDGAVVRSVLNCAGIDTSNWQLGLQRLINQKAPNDTLRRANRSRSRSPRREIPRDPRRRSPPRVKVEDGFAAAPRSRPAANREIYVVDVQAMHQVMSGNSRNRTVFELARDMSLPYESVGWCAGNECHTIIDIWKSLVSGLPIDEQKLMRAAKSQTVLKEDEPPSASSEAQALRDPDDSDDERDPNDAPFVSMPAASGSSYVDPYLDMDDDEPEDW